MKVLIVDDDEDLLELLEAIVSGAGHEVMVAADGSRGWQLFSRHTFDVVVTDWNMPEVDGIELCERIRRRERSAYAYVLLLTVRSGKQNFLAAMDAGADDFMSKPVDSDILLARLRAAQRVLELRTHVEQIGKLLPICMTCKKIRDSEDNWQPIEEYIGSRTGAEFSHGYCRACADKYLAEISKLNGRE